MPSSRFTRLDADYPDTELDLLYCIYAMEGWCGLLCQKPLRAITPNRVCRYIKLKAYGNADADPEIQYPTVGRGFSSSQYIQEEHLKIHSGRLSVFHGLN